MLSVSNISVSYDGSRILRNVDFTLPKNKLLCLMGRNGVGKSTTLKTIVGLLKPDEGSVKLDGEEMVGKKPEQRSRMGIGYVPQGRDIFANLTVWENLKISLVVHGKKEGEQVDRIFELFPVLKEMLKRKGGVLSGGQQQQLAIARAVLTDPKVLILDEPTEGIQPSIIKELAHKLVELKQKRNFSLIVSEQVLSFTKVVADRFLILEKGAVVYEATKQDLDDSRVHSLLTI